MKLNNKILRYIEKENTNRCRFCNKKVDGLSMCGCQKSKDNTKLWATGVRKKDRIRLVNRDVKLVSSENDNKGLKA